MDDKFQNQYRIPPARATWHDYNGGAYFVTICTKNREHFFGEIENVIMQLSATGKFADKNLQDISHHYPYAEIPLWIVMPNHIHVVVFIDGEKIPHIRCKNGMRLADDNAVCRDVARRVSTVDDVHIKNEKMHQIANMQGWLSVAIGGFKSAVTKFANENGIEFVWQTRFHDRIIRNQEEMNRIADYIENNPARWDMDCFNQTET